MGEIVTRFADGKLWVKEEKLVTEGYKISSTIGVPFRVGHIKTIEQILTLEAYVSGYPACRVETSPKEAYISGDTLLVVMRRGDVVDGAVSGSLAQMSGGPAYSCLSAITSGLNYWGEILSGYAISGKLNIRANVIGF